MTINPAEVWSALREGNSRFTSDHPDHPRQDARRRSEIALSQRPQAALFGCSDSRISAELIFDLGLGELFVVRNAGHIISHSVIGSLEYAVSVLGVSLIVVLAHDDCGALHAAVELESNPEARFPAHVHSLITELTPAVQRTRRQGGFSPDHALSADDIAPEHLRDTVAALISQSELIAAHIAEGTLAVVGARYRLVEGHVQAEVAVGLDEASPAAVH